MLSLSRSDMQARRGHFSKGGVSTDDLLTKITVNWHNKDMLDVEVIEQPAVAAVALDVMRSSILAHLIEPGSATTVANSLGLARQKVNYHLRLLEDHGLVRLVDEQPRRGLMARVMQASARSYVISSTALGPAAVSVPGTDRLSARYLIALGARLVNELAQLSRMAEQSGKTLSTLAIDTDLRFATARDRAAFTAELANAVTGLVAKYHDEQTPGGRWHRLVIAAHPRPAAQ